MVMQLSSIDGQLLGDPCLDVERAGAFRFPEGWAAARGCDGGSEAGHGPQDGVPLGGHARNGSKDIARRVARAMAFSNDFECHWWQVLLG